MRKWISIIILSVLLASGAIICAIRWQAWFSTPAEPLWIGQTTDYTFPAPCDEQDPHTLLVLGDVHSKLTRADYNLLAARVPEAEMVLQVGDMMERGQEYYYQLLMREWMNSDLCGLPVVACPGNHEYSKGLHKTLSPAWQKAFGERSSYYIDLGQTRLIIMDTNAMKHLVDFTRALTWLRTVMNSAEDKFIVVLMHHPVLPAAKGRFNPLVYATFRYALGQADLVLAGHDHLYMRRDPFVVLNTSGRAKEPQNLFPVEMTDTVPVYGVLQLEPSSITFRAYHLHDEQLIDSVYVSHD